MERVNYSRYAAEQLASAQSDLAHKLTKAEEVLFELPNDNYVRKRRRKISHQKWGKSLNLEGLTDDERRTCFADYIIPIQTELVGEVIPTYLERLDQIAEEKFQRSKTLVLNSMIEDPSFTPAQAMRMLLSASYKPSINPQQAVDSLTYAVDVLAQRHKQQRLDEKGAEVFSKIVILGHPEDQNHEGFKQDIENWFMPQQEERLPVPIHETTAVIPQALIPLANRIIDLVPEDVAKKLAPQDYQNQALAFAQFVKQFANEGGEPYDPREIMEASTPRKVELTQEAIRKTLAQMLITYPQRPLEKDKFSWGREIRALIDWLGGGRIKPVGKSSSTQGINEDAKTIITEAIDNLSEVERGMVLAISSVALLEDLGYLNLDECNEAGFAIYLRNAAFEPNIEDRDDSFEQLIVTAVERSDAGDLNLTELIEQLIQPPYEPLIIARMMESAKVRACRFQLIEIFAAHQATYTLAATLQTELINEDPDEEQLPFERGEFLFRRPRRRY